MSDIEFAFLVVGFSCGAWGMFAGYEIGVGVGIKRAKQAEIDDLIRRAKSSGGATNDNQ